MARLPVLLLLLLVLRLRDDGWFSGKHIVQYPQKLGNARLLPRTPISQVRMIDPPVDADVLARSYHHGLAGHHKDDDALWVVGMAVRYPYLDRESVEGAAKVDWQSPRQAE